jgi:hypothetical protein
MRNALLALTTLAVCLAFGPALGAGESEANSKRPEPGVTVEMPFLIAPVSVDGKLQGYAYISSKMVCSSSGAAILVRQKLAFIQDSFVREVNGKAIGTATDPKVVDKVQLNLRLSAAARRIVGDNKVVAMYFVDVKYNPLRPPESTEGAAVAPDEAAPKKGAGTEAETAAGASATSKSSKDNAATGESAQKSRPK